MTSLGTIAFGLVGLFLTLRVFRGIITGEMVLLFWTFSRNGREGIFWSWMALFAFISLAFYFAALKCYLGPLTF